MKKILILSLILLSFIINNTLYSQKNNKVKEYKDSYVISHNEPLDIKASFNIFLDNKKIETDSVLIGSVHDTSAKTYSIINDSFDTYLLPNKTYNMIVTHPNYNKQILKIITNKTNENLKVEIYLSSKDPDCYIGYYKYNITLRKYIQYE